MCREPARPHSALPTPRRCRAPACSKQESRPSHTRWPALGHRRATWCRNAPARRPRPPPLRKRSPRGVRSPECRRVQPPRRTRAWPEHPPCRCRSSPPRRPSLHRRRWRRRRHRPRSCGAARPPGLRPWPSPRPQRCHRFAALYSRRPSRAGDPSSRRHACPGRRGGSQQETPRRSGLPGIRHHRADRLHRKRKRSL